MTHTSMTHWMMSLTDFFRIKIKRKKTNWKSKENDITFDTSSRITNLVSQCPASLNWVKNKIKKNNIDLSKISIQNTVNHLVLNWYYNWFLYISNIYVSFDENMV